MLSIAQNSSNQEKVKEKRNFRPTEIKIGLNAIRTGRSLAGSDISTHELQLAGTFYKYNLVLDLGTEENNYGGSFDYTNTGTYVRIGVDRNFVKDEASGNVLSLGLRYCRAGLEDRLVFTGDQGFGEQTYVFSNNDLSARWMEVAFNLRGKVVSNLYMGFTMRWQFSRKLSGEGELKTFDIPGFGKTKRQNSTAFDYYIAWRIPLKKK